MSSLKLPYKIMLANIGLGIIFSFFIAQSNQGDLTNYAFTFGAVFVVGGMVDLCLGLLLLIFSKDWGKGFLLSAAALLLLGGITCGGLFAVS